MTAYLVFYGAALLLSVVLTSLAIRSGKRLDLMDAPGARKVHTKPVPCTGGLALYPSVVFVMLPIFLSRHARGLLSEQGLTEMSGLVLGATVVLLLGLVDDIRSLRARQKLLVQCAAAALVCYGGVRIRSVVLGGSSPTDLGWIAWPVTILWIVGITNAINLSDGVDGLATAISMIACAVIGLLAVTSDQPLVAALMLAMLGALTAFLGFNFHPARIFLGDSGSLFVGFVISAASVLCYMNSQTSAALVLPVVALGVPILDTLVAVVRRFASRRPIFAPDRGHFHHRLLQLGLGQRQVVGVASASTLTVTCLSMLMLFDDTRTSLIVLGGVFGVLLVFFYLIGTIRLGGVIAGVQKRLRVGRQAHEEICEFCHLQLEFDRARSSGTWWQVLCRMADRLDFAWVALDVTDGEGNLKTYLWRCPETPPPSARLTIVKVPAQTVMSNRSIDIEVAVLTNGSVEGAVRRASLFGRLMDEYKIPAFDGTKGCPSSTTDSARPRTAVSLRTAAPLTDRLDSLQTMHPGK